MLIFIYFSVGITKLLHPNIQEYHENNEYYEANYDFLQEYEEEYKPIRIMIDYSNLKNDKQIIEAYLNNAVEFIESTYSVRRSLNLHEIKSIQTCNDLQIPNQHQKNGVEGYDIIIYVGQYYKKQNTMASSKACLFNTQKRAIAATMKFNIRYFEQKEYSNPKKLDWLGIVVHEISHSLGFSKTTFERFNLLKQKHGKLYIHSHQLMEWGRKYFNCPTLEMLPLEDDGGEGTAGSHWERLTFGDEAMTGTDVAVFYYSQFTMLALESTGLYKANLNRASFNYNWGKNAGCEAIHGSCHSSLVCDQPHSSSFCSHDHLKIQYCRRHQVLTNCRLPRSIKDCRWEDNMHCFNEKDHHANCYRSECVENKIRVHLDGQWKFCEDVDQLLCPSPKDFCREQNCNARGNYVDGQCYCDIGFRGENCDQFVL